VQLRGQPHRVFVKDCTGFDFARCAEVVYRTGDYAEAPAARHLSSQAQPYNPVSTQQHLNFRYFDVPAGYANVQARLA
jgi:hypothetical protein